MNGLLHPCTHIELPYSFASILIFSNAHIASSTNGNCFTIMANFCSSMVINPDPIEERATSSTTVTYIESCRVCSLAGKSACEQKRSALPIRCFSFPHVGLFLPVGSLGPKSASMICRTFIKLMPSEYVLVSSIKTWIFSPRMLLGWLNLPFNMSLCVRNLNPSDPDGAPNITCEVTPSAANIMSSSCNPFVRSIKIAVLSFESLTSSTIRASFDDTSDASCPLPSNNLNFESCFS